MDSEIAQENKKRLIVLVPDCLADNMGLAHKIHWMAIRDACEVYYLTLVDDYEKMLAVSRCMATVKAVTAGNWLVVNSRVTETKEWLQTLRDIYRPGDIIVCHEEQLVKQGPLKTIPASEFLRETFHLPVYTISGFYHPQQVQVRHWLVSLLFWIGCLVILGIFTLLEIQMDQVAQGITRVMVLTFLVLFEVGAIWTWSSISR